MGVVLKARAKKKDMDEVLLNGACKDGEWIYYFNTNGNVISQGTFKGR